MTIKTITILLLTLKVSIASFGQNVEVNLTDSLLLNHYFQEIVVNIKSLPDSSMITISHITKHSNDSTYRMALRRHISFEGELLSTREYELTKRAGSISYKLETFNFISHFSNSNIFILAQVSAQDCIEASARRFKLINVDQTGDIVSEKYWCRDIYTGYSVMYYTESDSMLFALGSYGSNIHSLDLELSKIPYDFSEENTIVKIKSKDTSFRYLKIKNDTLFAAGTFNRNNSFYGPKTTWFGYIQSDSIVVEHEHSYFDDWTLNEFIWDGDIKQYSGSSGNTDISLLLYKKDKLKFNVFEGYYSTFLPLSYIESGYILPHSTFINTITEVPDYIPEIGFTVLNKDGFLKEKIIYEIPNLIYPSEYLKIGDRFFVYVKINNDSQLVRHKTHCYIFDLEE